MPYPFYAKVRQEEPITFNPILNAYLVSRYDDIRFIASRPDLFSSKDAIATRPPKQFSPETIAELEKGYPFRMTTIASDGARHTRLREPLQKAFAPTRVWAMEPSIRAIANKLVDCFIDDGQAEMIAQFCYPLPLEVIFVILGIPQQELAMIKKQSDDMLRMLMLPHLRLRQP